MRRATDQPRAPWHVIDATDPRSRNLAVTETLLARFRAHARGQSRRAENPRPKRPVSLRPAGLRVLQALPLDQRLAESTYEAKRDKLLRRLHPARRAAADRA